MAENQENGRKSGKTPKVKVTEMQRSQPLPPAPPIHDMISQRLKAYYSEIASEPIPDRLTALLAKLEAQSGKKQES